MFRVWTGLGSLGVALGLATTFALTANAAPPEGATAQPQARGDCLLWDTLVDSTQLQNIQGSVTVSNIIEPAVLGQRNVTVTITWVGSLKSDSTVKRARSLTINRVAAPE